MSLTVSNVLLYARKPAQTVRPKLYGSSRIFLVPESIVSLVLQKLAMVDLDADGQIKDDAESGSVYTALPMFASSSACALDKTTCSTLHCAAVATDSCRDSAKEVIVGRTLLRA